MPQSGTFNFYPNQKLQLLDIKGVKAGGQATINCPKGPRYKAIVLEFNDTGRADVHGPGTAFATDIQVVAGSKVVRGGGITGAMYDLINQGNGSRYAAISNDGAANGTGVTRLPIFFEEPWRKRADYQNGLACETGYMGSNDVFQVKVTIAAGVTPVLTAYAIVDSFSSGKPNAITKMYATNVNTSAASVNIVNPFQGLDANDLIAQISLFDPSDSVAGSKTPTSTLLKINNVDIEQNITRNQSDAYHIFYDCETAALAGVLNLTFDHDDLFESLRQVSSINSASLQVTFAAASAGTMAYVTQCIGVPT